MRQYRHLAAVYDRLLGKDVDYGAWAGRIEEIFSMYLAERPALVLDLACGTGNMTMALAARGYDMIGIDASEDMLSAAHQRAAEAELSGILYLHQDMRSFELYGTVGAVVCCLDGVNYLTGDGDLEKCFSLVHNYLDPNGLFLFDVNTPYRFERVYADNAYILEDEGVYCGWQNEYHAETGICDFYLTIFQESAGGKYRRTDEQQRERCYTEKILTQALEKCRFKVLAVYSGLAEGDVAPDSEKWTFVASASKDKGMRKNDE